jgi:GGDEF domain-containing protein
MPIAERMGLAKAELIKPGVERRKEAEREPAAWDKPFRAIHTKAQKQSEAQFMQEAATLLKKRDVGFMDLAKRLGVTIEAGYPIKDKLKTIYARIQSGAEPRKRTQEMSKEELKKELTTDYLTGLGNKHAFEIEDPRKAHVASIDLDSLKYFNDAFGHETGDEMLKNFGAALTPIKGSYHISGDEFIVQNDDTRALQDILENQIPKNLATNPITITLPDGKKIKYEVQFSYGTAKTISDAEERLQAHKAAREVAGERAGRGEIPSGLPGGPTKGERPGVKRKEVPKKELIGGPRRAPMRTTPPPKPKVEAPVKTVSYDIKAEFEYKNRKTLEGLSYIGKLVKRQLLPNGWIRLRYEKIEDFVPRDLWRENLIKTREVARSLGIPFEGLTHAELLGKIDAHEDAPKIPEGAPEGPTNRDLTIRRLGDIGTKIRFKTGYNKEILTITNIGPNGKVSYDGGKIYRSDFEFEAVSPEELQITAQPDIQMAMANETKVITPGNPRGYNARYAVVESDDLIPSHNPQTFQKNPDYPEGVQERTYHTDTREQEKVIKNAQHLSNAILLSDDPTPVNGPPIITPGGIVLGGNSRTMSIARAYRGKLGDRYKKALASSASKWGMDSEYITAMDKPVLVRRVYLEKGDIDTLHRMASDFNKSLTQGISQEAEIASMGRNISMDTVEKIGLRMANRDLTLRELLGKKDGLEVLNWLINDDVIPVTDENRFVDRKVNLLNEPGKILIEKALFGSIIDDADLISAAPKALINKIGRALPSLARIKARGDQWDITPEIKDALQLATEAHAADLSIREHLAQGSLFGDKKEYDNTTVGLAELLAKEKQIELAKRFKKFAADAMADVKDQGFLFEPKTFEQAFKDAFDIEVAARAPTPGAAIAPELMSPAEYITHVQAMERKGQDSGIDYAEKVEIEETGETIDRQIDAAGYLNDIDDEIEAYEELLNCIGGGS